MSPAAADIDVRTFCLKPDQLVPPDKPRYRIVGDIDEGALSKVWLARDTQVKERLVPISIVPYPTSARKFVTDLPLF